ncbi:DMT family transporter [Sciscionella sediminilitoris]|uniref:DMT family transporter n=1 Tax=Sciscionella sediminilitoris TaxID=1445613 RepID=UPI0004DFA915|nr:SMR family transporter [Sciscionella sp. SE31]
MKNWLFLAGAILCEVAGSLSLKAALHHPGWYAVVAVGYVTAFVFMGALLRGGMALGVAYGIWGAMGVALTAVFGAILFGEVLNVLMFAGMALIIGGVLLVEFGAQQAKRVQA